MIFIVKYYISCVFLLQSNLKERILCRLMCNLLFRQIVYQRGNQKEGSPHYIFLYSEDDQSEDEEHFPLKKRNRKPALPRKIQVINVQIQSEDTLQALALRYQCSVSDCMLLKNRCINEI
jgi:hypothetical protein